MKRVLSIFIAIAMVLTIMPAAVWAADFDVPDGAVDWDNLIFKKDDGSELVKDVDYTVTVDRLNAGLDFSTYTTIFGYFNLYTILTPETVYISEGSCNKIKDKEVKCNIICATESEANIVLKDVNCLGNLTAENGKTLNLTLEGTNNVDYIYGNDAKTKLIFDGNGTLNSKHIGGTNGATSAEIIINSGVINVDSSASTNDAAIGSNHDAGTASPITINGGSINVKAAYGAGIGSGQGGTATAISITGGNIKASASYGSAIGSGQNGIATAISISGGNITVSSSRSHFIGAGEGGTANTISFTGGTFNIDPSKFVAEGYAVKKNENETWSVTSFSKVLIPVGQNFVYDNTVKTCVAENDAYTLTGTAAATDAGKYTVTLTLKGGYQWNDNTREEKQIEWEIRKASQSAPVKGEGYDVNSSTGEISAKDGYELKTEGTSYFVRKKENDNYFASPYTAINTTLSVNAIASPANMGNVSVTGITDGKCSIGTSVTVTATASNGYKFVRWEDNGVSASTNAAYTFTAVTGKTLIAVFEPADKIVVQIPAAENKAYTGDTLTGVTATTNCLVSGNTGINAGTYTATATLTNETDYIWADGTTTQKTITWVIYKASQPAPTGVAGGENNITGVDATMEYMAKGGNGYVAISGNEISTLSAGTYYVRKAADTNHLASPAAVVTVKLPTITVTTIQPDVSGQTTAKLYGSVIPYNATRITAVGFEYKADGADEWTKVTVGTPAAAFNYELTNLTAGTKYFARAYVVADNETVCGAETTFYTLAAETTGEIDIFIDNPQNKSVTITVEKGNDVIASVALNESNWKINHLNDGFYNIVIRTTDGDFTETRLVEVTDGKAIASSFSIPEGKLATKVDVKTEETPAVAVDGLTEILTVEEKNAAAAGSVDVEVKLAVEAKAVDTTETETKAAVDSIKEVISSGVAIATEETIEAVLDLSLIKTTSELDDDGEVTGVDIQDIGSNNNKVLEIAVPYASANVDAAINVYRVHDGATQKLVQLSNRSSGSFVDGTYFLGDGYIFIYASDFSTYAISSVEKLTEFTVTFDANGGDCNTATAKTNTSRKLDILPVASLAGYSFDGWFTEKTGGTKITLNTEFMLDTTVYAQWTKKITPTGHNTKKPEVKTVDSMNDYKDCSKDITCPLYDYSDLATTKWYHDGIHFCLDEGLMNGVAKTQFNPDGKTTRGMMMTILARMDGTEVNATGSKWYQTGVDWARTNKISDGSNPEGNITREQFAVMLYNYAKLNGKGFVGSWFFLLDYKDADKISSWANEALHWCVMKEIMNGRSGIDAGKLDPQGLLTRAEAAAMIQRYCSIQ